MSADDVLDTQQAALAEWLPTSGGVRLDITAITVGHVGQTRMVLTMADGTTARVHLPLKARLDVTRLRRATAEPGRGAWTWARQWMSADEPTLHTDYDWTRQPRFTNSNDPDGYSPPSDFGCADELERFPRDARHTPDWLVQGAARGRRATQIYDRLEHALAHWLSTQEDAERIDIDSLALGRRTALRTTLTLTNGTTHHDIDPPDQVTSAITAITTELRDPQTQAKPHAGAWTREQISMETDDLKLVTILRMGPRPRLHRHRLRRRTPPPPPQPPAHPHPARPRRRTRPPPTQQTNHPLNTPHNQPDHRTISEEHIAVQVSRKQRMEKLMNVHDHFPDESTRNLLVEVLTENDPELVPLFSTQSSMTQEQVDRVDDACWKAMKFVGDNGDVPTERTTRLEHLIDVLDETRSAEKEKQKSPSEQDASAAGGAYANGGPFSPESAIGVLVGGSGGDPPRSPGHATPGRGE